MHDVGFAPFHPWTCRRAPVGSQVRELLLLPRPQPVRQLAHTRPDRRLPRPAAGFAWMLLGERLGAKGLAGAAIILASSLVTQVMGGQPQGDDGSEEQQLLAKEKAE